MNRYLLFSGDTYYPCGGAEDLRGDFDTKSECCEKFDKIKSRCVSRHADPDDLWGHVFDTQSNEIVLKLGRID